MKKAILFSSIFAIGAAVAVDSDNAIGVTTIKFNSTDKGIQKLVAVPFDGYVNGAVKVSDLVSPTGLAVGSKLYVVVNNGYAVWELSEEGEWESANVVSIGKNGVQSEVATSFDADKVTVKRGDAFWLEEPKTGSETTAYLLGQMPTLPETGTVSATGSKWNLVSNPLLTEGAFTGAEAGDIIYIQGANGAQVRCQMVKEMVNEKEVWNWKYRAANGEVVAATFAPGDGFWFYPRADRTLTWSAK